MSDSVETVRVQPWGEGQGAFVVINAADFDPAVHELYIEPGAEAASNGDDEPPADPGAAEGATGGQDPAEPPDPAAQTAPDDAQGDEPLPSATAEPRRGPGRPRKVAPA